MKKKTENYLCPPSIVLFCFFLITGCGKVQLSIYNQNNGPISTIYTNMTGNWDIAVTISGVDFGIIQAGHRSETKLLDSKKFTVDTFNIVRMHYYSPSTHSQIDTVSNLSEFASKVTQFRAIHSELQPGNYQWLIGPGDYPNPPTQTSP